MGDVRTSTWKKYRLLLTVLLIVVTLGAFCIVYSPLFRSAISPGPSSTDAKRLEPTTSIREPSPQNVRAGDTIARTFSSTSTPQNEKAISEKSTPPITIRDRIDTSVMGQAFEISSSIKEGCKSDHIECPLVMASVGKMVKEPRDIEWAARMEATIQSAFDSQGSGKYVIRNVECRTSICILEVEGHNPEATDRYNGAIVSSLRPHALTSVREHDSSGSSYRVELMDFERR
jgi:hypothetical protein